MFRFLFKFIGVFVVAVNVFFIAKANDCNNIDEIVKIDSLNKNLEEQKFISVFLLDKKQEDLKLGANLFFVHDFSEKTYNQALEIIKKKKKEACNIYELFGLCLFEVDIINVTNKNFDLEQKFPAEKIIMSWEFSDLSVDYVNKKIQSCSGDQKKFILGLYYAIKGEYIKSLELFKETYVSYEEQALALNYIISKCIEKDNNSLNEAVYKNLYKLYEKHVTVEENNFNRMEFSFVSSDKDYSGRYYLEDNHGNAWFFKETSSLRAVSGVLGYRLNRIFGCNTPEAHELTFRIEENNISGYVQKFIPDAKLLQRPDVNLFSESQVRDVLLQEIIDWLFISNDTEFIVFHGKDFNGQKEVSKVFGVDKDEVLGQEAFSFGEHYEEIWDGYVKTDIDVDINDCMRRVEFIANFPNTLFARTLEPYVDRIISNGVVYRDYEGKSIKLKTKKDFFSWLFDRKPKMKEFFTARYILFKERYEDNFNNGMNISAVH